MPNAGSPRATPAWLAVDLSYEEKAIWSRWTHERFVRLCKFLNLTPEELASVACIPHRTLGQLEERNHLYIGHMPNRAGALILTMLEAHVCQHFTDDVVKDVFPNLNVIQMKNGS